MPIASIDGGMIPCLPGYQYVDVKSTSIVESAESHSERLQGTGWLIHSGHFPADSSCDGTHKASSFTTTILLAQRRHG